MKRCIVCSLQAVHTHLDLIRVCTRCNTPPLARAFTRRDALQDDKCIVRSITSTLSPRLQKADPDVVHQIYKEIIPKIIRQKNPAYIECTFEYTKGGVLHMHGYIVARKYLYAKVISALKRLGFVKTDPITDLEGWIEYMYKDQDCDSYPVISLSS